MKPRTAARLVAALVMLGFSHGRGVAGAGGEAAPEDATPSIVLTISGSPGIQFTARCVLARGGVEETVELQGTVPARHGFAADALRCRIENRSGTGELQAEARKGSGALSRSSASGGGAIILSIR